ncbi:MAG TPA: DNA-binding domain-containing protein [Alphaproteobacteria bacterium]
MTALAELQRRFHAAVLEGREGSVASLIEGDGIAPDRRLQIHRNAARLLLIEALTANFPATCRMVGGEFFTHAAAEFIRRHPPRLPRLAEYGAELPDFLASFPPAATLPWLSDLARLEWAMLACQEAEEGLALTAADLEERAPETLPQLRFAPHPACRLLASPWPVDRIRSFALAPDGGFAPAMQGDPVRLLIRRTAAGVMLRRLGDADFTLLERLLAGFTLGEALEGLESDPAPVLAAALREDLFAKS